jgi:hypothetical protein
VFHLNQNQKLNHVNHMLLSGAIVVHGHNFAGLQQTFWTPRVGQHRQVVDAKRKIL